MNLSPGSESAEVCNCFINEQKSNLQCNLRKGCESGPFCQSRIWKFFTGSGSYPGIVKVYKQAVFRIRIRFYGSRSWIFPQSGSGSRQQKTYFSKAKTKFWEKFLFSTNQIGILYNRTFIWYHF